MAGTRGKSKASLAKLKHQAPSMMSVVPGPVVAEKSSEGPSNGEEKKIEILSTKEKENDCNEEIPSTDEKENDDTTSGLVVGNGFEENQTLADEGNDDEKSNVEKDYYEINDNEKNADEKDVTNELNTNEVYRLSGQTEQEPEEVNDGDVAYAVDSEIYIVDTKEENVEELSDVGGAVNNVNVEDNEGQPDDEVAMENKEPINDCGNDENIRTGEEIEDTEVAEGGEMVTGEGLASEYGVIDEGTMRKGESYKLNAEEPFPTPADNKEMAEERENFSIANNVKASADEAKKPKRKIIRKKLIKKVRKIGVASNDEAKAQSSIVNNASGNVISAETNEHERNGEKAEIKPPVRVNKKLNRKRKKSVVSESNAGVAVFTDGLKAEPTNNEQGTEVLKEADKVEVEGNKKAKKSRRKANLLKKKRKQKLSNDETTGNVVTGDTNKSGPSQKGKSKKVDAVGMIFMCNSETKKDCYRYKVLGLPAGKKDFVLKICEGMKLFLFDVQLKMLYGIYKAAASGGFNIEPKAFKSKFPSQVRFTVVEECVPLAEENFKRVIKENYYTKNKFNCNLTGVQVEKLCKLFRETTRKADSTRIVRNPVETASSSALQDRKRKRKRTEEGRKVGPASSSKRDSRRRHAEKEARRGPAVVDDRYYQRPVAYEREAYLPPPAPPVQVVYQALHPPIPPRPSSYSYGGPSRDDIYRREPAPLERVPVVDRREVDLSSLRLPAQADRREPYASYRESRTGYFEPAYEPGIRRDLYESSIRRDVYEPSVRRDMYEPSARRDLYEPSARRDLYEPSARRGLYEPSVRREQHHDYTSDARHVEYYGAAAEYRAPLPPHRSY